MTLGSDGATSIAPTDDASLTASRAGYHVTPALVVFQTPPSGRPTENTPGRPSSPVPRYCLRSRRDGSAFTHTGSGNIWLAAEIGLMLFFISTALKVTRSWVLIVCQCVRAPHKSEQTCRHALSFEGFGAMSPESITLSWPLSDTSTAPSSASTPLSAVKLGGAGGPPPARPPPPPRRAGGGPPVPPTRTSAESNAAAA